MHRIVYDYQTFSLQQYGGISRYFCEIAARIMRAAEFDVKVVAPVHYNDYLAASDVGKIALHIPQYPRTERLYGAINRFVAPPITNLISPAIVHQTYYSASCAPRSAKKILTVHDMIHELFPEHFLPNDPTAQKKLASVAAADHVLCVSESTKADLIRLLDVDPQKVTVTHLGCSGIFSDPGIQIEIQPVDRPYILHVGHRGGYKNFAKAVEAYASSQRLLKEFDLVTFGGFPFSQEECALIDSLGVRPGSVRRIAGNDMELARAYAGARVLIYPSLYEGFGIPALEAMNCRCPVVGANTSSIPEVVGPAAELFDPTNTDSIRAALEKVCFDDEQHARLIQAGLERVKYFSWDKCANETLQVYRAVLRCSTEQVVNYGPRKFY